MTDLTSPKQIRALLTRHGIRPRKRWGQHFLADRNTLDRILAAAELETGPSTGSGAVSDLRQLQVLEIGPGLGVLTRELCLRFARVTAVEIDPLLKPVLSETLGGLANAHLKFGDFLDFDPDLLTGEAFGGEGGYVVANIPYNITTPILERLFTVKERVARIVLLVQRELADRLVAVPGTKDYGSLSVYAQFHAAVRRAGTVPRTVFYPSPEVESAIVVLDPVVPSTASVSDPVLFERVVGAAFGQRRKTLGNSLAAGFPDLDRAVMKSAFETAAVEPSRRGETLSLEEFAQLANRLSACLKGEPLSPRN